MKKVLTPLLLAALALSASAQKNKPVQLTPQQLMQQYRYDEAADRLEAEIAQAKKRRKPFDALAEQLAVAQRMAVVLEGTQQITFVDSLVVEKEKMLEALHLGAESGTVTTFSRAFGKADTLGCTAYQSQLGNLTLFAQPVNGRPKLHSATLVGGSWSEATPLEGLPEDDECQNFPFMLSDGVTFYYGAVNPEGLGGYDIYFSRFDNEDRVFRAPENAGMPFNSPANDYMLAIDDFNSIGYLVTDRCQPAGKVCIYSFIPPKVRVNLADTGISDEELRQLARISSIAATQKDKQAVADARQRIAAMGQAQKGARQYDFTFVVDDAHVCHYASDFRNAEARKRVETWLKTKQQLDDTAIQLEAARNTYASANETKRNSLRQQILNLESAYEQALGKQAKLEKEIRKLESKKQ